MFVVFCEVFLFVRCLLLVVGGLRFDETMVEDFGVDCVFICGTMFGEVVSYFVYCLVMERKVVL